jgi:ureidoacrylate peracid hydrolase
MSSIKANQYSRQGASYLPKSEAGAGFPPDQTALLIIDPVNDFLSEGGAAWDLTKSMVMMNDVIGNLKRAIEGARTHGIPVLFAPMAYTAEDYTKAALHHRSGINRIIFERKMFLAGSWGADFHSELQPQDEDIVLLPHKGTDVFKTDLPEHLRRLGTTHLVIAGMTANLCCESTGRHAAEEGYDVTYLSDAIGAESLPAYEASILLNYPLVGNAVMTADEFLSIVDAGEAESSGQVRPNDVVYGSDHGEIGTVKNVVQAAMETEAYMLVPRGLVFTKDTYIPLDAVAKRSGTQVFINVPKLVVSMMPWGQPPSRAELLLKYGPSARIVDKLYHSRSPSVGEHT